MSKSSGNSRNPAPDGSFQVLPRWTHKPAGTMLGMRDWVLRWFTLTWGGFQWPPIRLCPLVPRGAGGFSQLALAAIRVEHWRMAKLTLLAGLLAGAALGCSSNPKPLSTAEPRPIRTYPDRVHPGLPGAGFSSAPTLAQPLTRGVGSTPAFQSSSASESQTFGISPAGEDLRAAPTTPGTIGFHPLLSDLPSRVREALATGRPNTITRLTPERLVQFEIEAANGVVTLRGPVRSEAERLMIVQRVATLEGVRAVNNQLRVIQPSNPGRPEPAESAPRSTILGQEY